MGAGCRAWHGEAGRMPPFFPWSGSWNSKGKAYLKRGRQRVTGRYIGREVPHAYGMRSKGKAHCPGGSTPAAMLNFT
jgi:hypothetical protein